MNNKVNILGTEYTILIRKYDEDARFKDRSIDGYYDAMLKQLVICDMRTWPEWEKESEEYVDASMRQTLRHEIVHAFFGESGLMDSSFKVGGPWATNEEMVDWIAVQGPKIHAAWQAVGAL